MGRRPFQPKMGSVLVEPVLLSRLCLAFTFVGLLSAAGIPQLDNKASSGRACPAELDANAVDRDSDDDMGLIQVASASLSSSLSRIRALEDVQIRALEDVQKLDHEGAAETCSSLENHGSYFNIAIEVGTPGQRFDLVADTGSNALIVPDCHCKDDGLCKDLDRCFKAKASTTFSTPHGESKSDPAPGSFIVATMTYGSGTITSVVSSDVVAVAGIKTDMQGGLFLMEDDRLLAIDGGFQGIFPLGVPGPMSQGQLQAPLWAQAANLSRYSLCFNGEGRPGKFAVNLPQLPNPLPNIGVEHWGLDLQGMSVGNASAPVLFCSPSSKSADMQTACGAIPDSGTTLFMGPRDQILQLYDAICDEWPRCREAAAEKPGVLRHMVFHELLHQCGSWLTEDLGIAEIPPINLHVAGHTYQLSPGSFIFETTQELFAVITGRLFGTPLEFAIPTGQEVKTCSPSFAPNVYETTMNGPVWIFGSALFFEYSVGYDISSQPMAISIMDMPCTECGAPPVLLSGPFRRTRITRPRVLKAPLRETVINVSRPL